MHTCMYMCIILDMSMHTCVHTCVYVYMHIYPSRTTYVSKNATVMRNTSLHISISLVMYPRINIQVVNVIVKTKCIFMCIYI